MRFVPLALVAGLAGLLLGGGGAMAACKSAPDSLFVDQFEQLDDTWGTSRNYDVEDGKLVFKPPAGYNTTAINNTSLYDDIDICVEVSAEAPLEDGSCASIVFWAIDYDNYYSFQISTDGQASFWRRQRNKWLQQVDWMDAPGAAKGATVINELRVITSGRTAKLYVNGQFFRQVKGQPPKDGSLIGVMACAPNEAAARITFANLVVNPPKPETEPGAGKPAQASGTGASSAGGGQAGKPADSGGASGGAAGSASGGGSSSGATGGSGDNSGSGGGAATGGSSATGGNGGSASGGGASAPSTNGGGDAGSPGAGSGGDKSGAGGAGSTGGSTGGDSTGK